MAEATPGVLPDTDIAALFETGAIRSTDTLDDDQIQPASLDLRLGPDAYRIRASFLPGPNRSVTDVLQEPGIELHRIDLTVQGAVLETGCVYLVPLMESLRLPPGISGRANPKSSTGRIDVFTRLVTNRGKTFDDIATGYSGPLWLEISPRTFSIFVRPGDRLAQLRLRRGKPQNTSEKTVSIDMQTGDGPVGWRANHHVVVQYLGLLRFEARAVGPLSKFAGFIGLPRTGSLCRDALVAVFQFAAVRRG